MPTLNVPSLQHLARNWRADPQDVKRLLVQLAKNSPTFNYNPLYAAARDMVVFNQPYASIAEGFRRCIGRKIVFQNFMEVLALMRDHFSQIQTDFVHQVQPRYYPVGRELLVPFQPPFLYGAKGRVYFPWMSFWRSNPLSGQQLSLFVSIIEEILLQDPDLEEAKFEILDFSAPSSTEPRALTILDAKKIPRVSAIKRTEMLAVFADGYFLAKAELGNLPRESETKSKYGSHQPGLFDEG